MGPVSRVVAATLLAEAAGLGSADLAPIYVRGTSIKDALYDFESRRKS
jgi:hypothetical protein